MQKLTATALTILVLAGCAGSQDRSSEESTAGHAPSRYALDVGEIRRTLEKSMLPEWKIGSLREVNTPTGWHPTRYSGVEINLIPPEGFSDDPVYRFWAFPAIFESRKRATQMRTETPAAFYYNQNRTYMLFFQPDMSERITVPLNYVSLALGITEVGAEINTYSRDQITGIHKTIMAQLPPGREYADFLGGLRMTEYALFISINTRNDKATRMFISAAAGACPDKTLVLLRVDGRHQDCIIVNAESK